MAEFSVREEFHMLGALKCERERCSGPQGRGRTYRDGNCVHLSEKLSVKIGLEPLAVLIVEEDLGWLETQLEKFEDECW